MVFGIRLSIGTVGEQADNLEVTDRAAAYQDCHGHLWAPYHIGPNSSQVASSPSGDLFICAKDLFVEATQASKPCHSTGSSTATTIKSHLLPRGPLLENMLEDREPVVTPEHLRTDKERRHSKRAATEGLFRGRGKDSLGFSILKCRPKRIGSEADLFCQRDTDGLVDRPGIRSVDRCAYPPAVIRGSAKPLGCRSGTGEEPEIEVMTRRLSEPDSVVVGPETRIAFSV